MIYDIVSLYVVLWKYCLRLRWNLAHVNMFKPDAFLCTCPKSIDYCLVSLVGVVHKFSLFRFFYKDKTVTFPVWMVVHYTCTSHFQSCYSLLFDASQGFVLEAVCCPILVYLKTILTFMESCIIGTHTTSSFLFETRLDSSFLWKVLVKSQEYDLFITCSIDW